jgi:hypothetical protein
LKCGREGAPNNVQAARLLPNNETYDTFLVTITPKKAMA